MKRMLRVVGVVVLFGWSNVCYADTLSGKVTNMDTAGNSLTLLNEKAESGPVEYSLVWEDTLSDQASLEKTNVGDLLTVTADQNPLTRNWKVTSVGGAFADAENALLRSGERVISGEIRSMDPVGNVMALASKELDVAGNPIEYRVVWDDDDNSVRDKLENSKIGDHISLSADQNAISRNWKAKSIAGPIESIIQADVRTLTGEIKKIDPDRNYLVLASTDPSSGRPIERKIVWDKDFKEQTRLEKARIGERLSVRADQNFITRNWEVKSLG